MQHVAPVHIRTTLVSGATTIEQFLFIEINFRNDLPYKGIRRNYGTLRLI